MKIASYYEHSHDIVTIDTGYIRPNFDASHLIVEGEQAAFLDVGTSHSVPRLLKGLEMKGIAPENVQYVMITHVHLDHAGGAGALLQHLPNAKLVVHPRGARHMIDPAKLIAGATAVYGEERFQKHYGTIVSVPEDRVIIVNDLDTLSLNGRSFLFLDTPGHARHHYCLVDEKSNSIFSGDTFGLSYRDLDSDQGEFIIPTTTPVQFDPEAMHQSINRMMSYSPDAMFLTHYSRVSNLSKLADDLHQRLEHYVSLAHEVADMGEERDHALYTGLQDIIFEAARKHGSLLTEEEIHDLLIMDVELNAQGLGIWLDKQK